MVFSDSKYIRIQTAVDKPSKFRVSFAINNVHFKSIKLHRIEIIPEIVKVPRLKKRLFFNYIKKHTGRYGLRFTYSKSNPFRIYTKDIFFTSYIQAHNVLLELMTKFYDLEQTYEKYTTSNKRSSTNSPHKKNSRKDRRSHLRLV